MGRSASVILTNGNFSVAGGIIAAFVVALGCSDGQGGGSTAGSGGDVGSGGSASGGGPSSSSGGVASGGEASGGTGSGGEPGAGGAPGSGGDAGSGGSASQPCRAPSDAGDLTTLLPCLLSETGLYEADMVTLAEGVHPYQPSFFLWTDGAVKKRWISLPPGETIDTSTMDYWEFPAGTKLFKEFNRDGVRVETRLLEKQETGAWYAVAYLWRDDQMEADAVPNGMENASGTPHDVPNAQQCLTCHNQQPDKILGFSAIQLSHDPAEGEWAMQTLIDQNLLSDPPAAPLSVPGTDDERNFFGYLHSNCGHCHNPKGTANAQTGLDLWLRVDELSGPVTEFSSYKSIYDVDIVKLDGAHPDATKRVDPGNLENSAIYQRFINKGEEWSMPPLGTEDVDPTGKQYFETWIESLGQ